MEAFIIEGNYQDIIPSILRRIYKMDLIIVEAFRASARRWIDCVKASAFVLRDHLKPSDSVSQVA